MRFRWIAFIILAAAIGSIAFDVTGSSQVAYVVRSIVRGLGH